MNGHKFNLCKTPLVAMGSGSLWWPDRHVLIVSDLHLGKSDRLARRGGMMLPPYETRDTLGRLETDINALNPLTVICLGDSFDDRTAALSLDEEETLWITRLQAGRRWMWVEGNHDPGPLDFGGSFLAELQIGPLMFRHIAKADAAGEVSGHYHPKARISVKGRSLTRPAFLYDDVRLVMPAFGTYTGGLRSNDVALCELMAPSARAIMLGSPPQVIPMPR
jgi:DNA ligase-associated metallophosphoesterase